MLPAADGTSASAPAPTISPPHTRREDGGVDEDDFLFGYDGVDATDDLFFEHLEASDAFASPTGADQPLPPLPLFPVSDVSASSGERAPPRSSPDLGPSASHPEVSFPTPLDRFPPEETPAVPTIPDNLPAFLPDQGGAADGFVPSTARVSLLGAADRPARVMTTANDASFVSRQGKRDARSMLANSASSPTSAGTSYRTVCMLVVGTSMQEAAMEAAPAPGGGVRAGSPGDAAAAALTGHRGGDGDAGLATLISMLTRELDRHGLKPEIDQVASGERAVQRVKALARHGLRYRVVFLKVEGTLARAAATARDLRAANATAPIVAVAAPHMAQEVIAQTRGKACDASSVATAADANKNNGGNGGHGGSGGMSSASTAASSTSAANKGKNATGRGGIGPAWRATTYNEALVHFSEFLTTPVSSAGVRGLIARWLLVPAEHAAPLGLAGANGSGGVVGAGVSIPYDAPPDSAHRTKIRRETAAVHRPVPRLPAHIPPTPSIFPSAMGWAAGSFHALGRRVNDSPMGFHSPPPANMNHHGSLQVPPTPQKGRVFGGTESDRASPCRLFTSGFVRENVVTEEREFDFVFRHGTLVLRVEEDRLGRVTPIVYGACEYATEHLGDLRGRPLQVMLEGAATNKKTVASILQHIEDGDTDSMCSYINLKSESEGKREMASFVSLRSLSKRPERCLGREARSAWYMLLKVCLPSTLGLIKEPALLDKMYSRAAMAVKGRCTSNKKGVNGGSHSKSGSKGGRGKAPPSGKRPSKRATRGGGLCREESEEAHGSGSSVAGSGAEMNSVGLLLRQQQQGQEQEQEPQAGVRLGVEVHLPHDQDLDAELSLL